MEGSSTCSWMYPDMTTTPSFADPACPRVGRNSAGGLKKKEKEEKVKLGDCSPRSASRSEPPQRLGGQNSAVRMSREERSRASTPTDWGKQGPARRCANTGGGISEIEMLCRVREERKYRPFENKKWENQPGYVRDRGHYEGDGYRTRGYTSDVTEVTVNVVMPPPGLAFTYDPTPARSTQAQSYWYRVDARRKEARRRHREHIEEMNEDWFAHPITRPEPEELPLFTPNSVGRAKAKFLAKHDTLSDTDVPAHMYFNSLLSVQGQMMRERGQYPRLGIEDRESLEYTIDYIKKDVDRQYEAWSKNEPFVNTNLIEERYDFEHYEEAMLEHGEADEAQELAIVHYEEQQASDGPETWDVVRESVHLAIAGFLASLESLGGSYADLSPMLRNINAAILGLCTARHWSGVAVHILQLIKTVSVEIDLKQVMEYLRSGTAPVLQSKVVEDFDKMMAASDDDDLPWWMSATDIVQVLLNAPIGQRVIKFLSQIIALKIISRERLKFEVWGMAMFDVPEAVGCVSIANAVDMFISILRRAHKVIVQCFSEQSLTPLAYDDIDIPKFDRAYLIMQNLGKALKQGNLDMVHDVSEDEFDEMLKKTEKLGERMLAKKTNGMVKELIMKKVALLAEVRAQFELYTRAKGIKPLDFLITLYGPTGCGKTIMAYPIMQSVLYYNGLPHTRDRIATLQESDAYDTLAKSNILCYYLDDLANFKLKNGQSPAQMIIRLVNTARNPAIKADVDEKGRVFFNHAFTLITTNVEMFDIKEVANCESSILRRQAVTVVVLPRPHLCLGDSIIMDSHLQKLHLDVFGPNKGLLQNYQWFTPRRVIVTQNKAKNREDTNYVPATVTKKEYPMTYAAVVEMIQGLAPYYYTLSLHFASTMNNVYDHLHLGPDERTPYNAFLAHQTLFKLDDRQCTLNTINLTSFMTFLREDTAIHRAREVEVANRQMDENNFGWCKVCNKPTATCSCGRVWVPPPSPIIEEPPVPEPEPISGGEPIPPQIVSRSGEVAGDFVEDDSFGELGPVFLESGESDSASELSDDQSECDEDAFSITPEQRVEQAHKVPEPGDEPVLLPMRRAQEVEKDLDVLARMARQFDDDSELQDSAPRVRRGMIPRPPPARKPQTWTTLGVDIKPMQRKKQQVCRWLREEVAFRRALLAARSRDAQWWFFDNIHRFPHGLERHMIVDGCVGDLVGQVLTYKLAGYITRWNTKCRLHWLLQGYAHPTAMLGYTICALSFLLSLPLSLILFSVWTVVYYRIAKIATSARLARSEKPMWEMMKPYAGDAVDTIVPIVGLVALTTALLRIKRKYYPNAQAQPDSPYSYVNEDTEQPAKGKAATMTIPQISGVVAGNFGTICVRGPRGRWSVNIVGIRGTLWLCPRHVFSAHGDLETYSIQAWRHGGTQKPITSLHRDSLSPIGVKDLVLVNLPDLGLVKDIVDLLPSSEPKGSRFCQLIHRNEGAIQHHAVKVDTVHVILDKPPEYNWPGVKPSGRRQVYKIASDTTSGGSCGSPMISNTGKEKMIVGFHVMRLASGKPYDKCGLETVTAKEFHQAAARYSAVGEVVGQNMKLEMHTVEGLPQVEKGAVHPRHSINFVENPDEATVLGHWHARSTPQSKVQPSLIATDVERAFGLRPNMFGPPPFRYFEDGTPNWPYTVGLEQITHRGAHYIMDAVPTIRRMLLQKFAKDLPEIRVLTQHEIRNGLPDKSVNPLNMRSSAGHPYNKEKRKMSPSEEPPYELHASAWEGLARFERSIDAGNVEIQLFKATLKDEPVLTGQKKKARLFQASSLTLTLWIRKHLGWLCSHMALYNLSLGVAIGMDCQGVRWQEMIDEFDTGDEDIIQYDYKKFDQHVSPAMKSEVVRFVCELMKLGKADVRWVEHVRRGLSQWIFPASVFDGVILHLRNSNPSGIAVTTAFNCIDNMYRSFCAVYLITGRLDFETFCKIMTYGDDAFLRCFDKRVTLQTMAYAFSQMGMQITPTQKDLDLASAPGRIRMRDIDFLSRSSVWHESLGRHLGALQDESLFKGILVRASDISAEEHAVAAAGSVLYEAFARGPDFYDNFRQRLGAILACHKLDATVDWQMSYAERAAKRKSNKPEGTVEHTSPVGTRDLREHLQTDLLCQPCSDDATLMESSLFSDRVSVPGLVSGSPYQAVLESTTHSWPASSNNTQTTPTNAVLGQTMFHMDRPDHVAHTTEHYDSSRDSAFVSQMQLSDWFERPVQIRELAWPTAGFSDVFDPWTAYMNNNTIKEKMEGYAWFSGTLHLKFVVTGQQFVYGRAIAGYDPFVVGNRLNKLPLPAAGDEQMRITQLSQRQHLYLNPTTNTGGDMVLPFFFPQDLCPLRASSVASLGAIHIQGISSLKTVRETTPKATITVYAWMPDLKLAGPTTVPVLQSEVEETKLSSKLQVVSRISSMLSSFPVIGPYATAAAVFAKNAANVALHYGYSRPESMGHTTRFWWTEGPPIAHAVGETSNTTISFDPKCTTTVDPSVSGIESTDEMSLQVMRQRESYFSVFQWPEAANQGALLASYKISPSWATNNSVTGTLCPTSLAYATYPFQYWRGTIKMRFQIVAAAVHTGVLRFVYDVNSDSTGLLDVAEQNKLRVLNVDISKERDITINFPYMQFRPYLGVAPFHTDDAGINEQQTNGILRIYVMNALVSSSADAPPVEIILSIAAGDDFEAWSPLDRYSIYQPVLESGEVPQIGTEISDSAPEGEVETQIVDSYMMPQHTGIFYGDPVLSVRYLLKRFYLTLSVDPGTPGTWNTLLACIHPNNSPAGASPITIHLSPFQYWAAGFVGWRGSLNKRVMGFGRAALSRRRVTGTQLATVAVGTNTAFSNTLASPMGTESSFRAVMALNFPWYNPERFYSSSLIENLNTPQAERYQVAFETLNGLRYCELTSAGEDFTYLFYVGAPRLRTVA